MEIKRHGAILRTVVGDIAKVNFAQAIVNPSNKTLMGGGACDTAIRKAAGPGLKAECLMMGGCDTGEAKITGAYNLPCDFIIHTVAPVWQDGRYFEKEFLANCYKNALEVGLDYAIHTIAFPSIATGTHLFPMDEASIIAVRAVDEFLEKHPDYYQEIYWVLFDVGTKMQYDEAIRNLCYFNV